MNTPRQFPIIGIIGGVGSGKSSLARGAAENLGLTVINADVLGHQALEVEQVQKEIRQQFGDEVFDDAGHVNRRVLSSRVFGSEPAAREQLKHLEQIVHPQIRGSIRDAIQHATSVDPPPAAVLLDAAVLMESGWDDLCDQVVFIDTPVKQRLARVLQSRGWEPEELIRRESSQLDIETKRQRADFIIPNHSTLPDAIKRFQEVIQRIIADWKTPT